MKFIINAITLLAIIFCYADSSVPYAPGQDEQYKAGEKVTNSYGSVTFRRYGSIKSGEPVVVDMNLKDRISDRIMVSSNSLIMVANSTESFSDSNGIMIGCGSDKYTNGYYYAEKFYASRSGSEGSYVYSNEIEIDTNGWCYIDIPSGNRYFWYDRTGKLDCIGDGYNLNYSANRKIIASSNSVAIGHSAQAKGNQSLALGWNSLASGANSVAVGVQALAEGKFSVALGSGAQSTTYTESEGRGIPGVNATSCATGTYSIAIGFRSAALSDGAISIGADQAYAKGDGSVALGLRSRAKGSNAIAIGRDSSAGEYEDGRFLGNSVAIGPAANAEFRGIAIGNTTTAKVQSVAIGYNSTGKTGSVIVGSEINASSNSTAIGYNSACSNLNSIAIGNHAIAEGRGALAIGTKAIAVGDDSIAIGNIASHEGEYPSAPNARARESIAIGYKSDTGSADNIASITIGALSRNVGNVGGAIAIGHQANAEYNKNRSSTGQIAIGEKSRASGSAISIGNGAGLSWEYIDTTKSTRTNGTAAVQIGVGAFAEGDYSIAIGGGLGPNDGTKDSYRARTTGSYTVQIGPGRNYGSGSIQFLSTKLFSTKTAAKFDSQDVMLMCAIDEGETNRQSEASKSVSRIAIESAAYQLYTNISSRTDTYVLEKIKSNASGDFMLQWKTVIYAGDKEKTISFDNFKDNMWSDDATTFETNITGFVIYEFTRFNGNRYYVKRRKLTQYK